MKNGMPTSIDKPQLDTCHRKHLNKKQIWRDCSLRQNILARTLEQREIPARQTSI